MIQCTLCAAHDLSAIKMPARTAAPLVLSLGIALVAAGVVLNPGMSIVGIVLVLAGTGRWIEQLLPGRGHELVKLVEPGLRPRPIIATPGMVEVLRPGMAGYRMRLPEKVHPISAGVERRNRRWNHHGCSALTYGVLSGHGIWFPVNLLAGAVLPGVDEMTTAELDQFHPLLLSLAIAIHAVTSMIVGLLYGVLLPTLPHFAGGWIVWGGIVIPLLWTGQVTA